MHDSNGTPLKDGDQVILTGTFHPAGDADSDMCNGTVDFGQPPGTGFPAGATINARHCTLLKRPAPPEKPTE